MSVLIIRGRNVFEKKDKNPSNPEKPQDNKGEQPSKNASTEIKQITHESRKALEYIPNEEQAEMEN